MPADAVRFECRQGWHGLIQKAADEVATFSPSWGVRLVGGKEKLGSLVLFVRYDDTAAMDAVEAFIEDFRKRSLGVCEQCGRRGRLRLGVVAATRCEDHADFVAPFRDEDGEIIDLPPTGGPIWKDGRKASYSPCE